MKTQIRIIKQQFGEVWDVPQLRVVAAFFSNFIPRYRFASQQYSSLMAQGENHPFLVAENLREVHGASEILSHVA